MVICGLLAVAALLWPGRAFRAPHHEIVRHRRQPPGGGRRAPVAALGGAAGCAAVWAGVVAGPVGLLAAAAVIGTGFLLGRRALADRRERTGLTDILAGLRMLGRELRAGAEPGVAARSAGSAARGDGAVVLLALADMVHTDDRAARAIDGHRDVFATSISPGSPPAAWASARLRSGWLLSRRHGVAFTPLIDALATDLAEQQSAAAERSGEVAGPRMSGYVMALLPLLGIALGSGMGADPVQVLLSSALGNILMLAGIGLTCLGLLWSDRIVRR